MSSRLDKRFPEKRIMVTGGASGLGKALALRFAREGWKVAIADLNTERITQTEEELAKSGVEHMGFRCDVTQEGDLRKAAAALKEKWGGLDILVNNAGVAGAGMIEKITDEEWNRIIGVNFLGVVKGCRVFVPLMKEQGGGHIVNVSAVAGFASLPEMSSYNATKAAAISLSETLRVELAPYRIGVTVVCPTFIPTNLMESFTSPDERQRRVAGKFFNTSTHSIESFSDRVYKAVSKGRLYAVTERDGRLIWFIKRLFPELYYRLFAGRYSRDRDMFERHLDGKKRLPAP
ncbi:MAG: SDR family oxidoreductase [Myxococcota bacterium]|jgi:NAD(P)-dependent dehydrogenase (short-subunit alcohol dehydrogenase family)